jgi:sugar/nucleoside kinase (ribokinase family)
MKLLLIGHSVVDLIDKDGQKLFQPGGIFYSASAIKELSSSEDQIFLCTQIDDEHFQLFKNVYDCFDLSFTEKVKTVPLVELTLTGDFERKEHYSNIADKLAIDFSKLNDFDGILVNMITGFDIDLIQLKKIRQSTNALIYFDVHTLSRGVDQYMHRAFRKIKNFHLWLENIDVIQCNDHELYTLSEKQDEFEIVKELFGSGVKIVCLTKGAKGVRVYYRNRNEIASFFRATRNFSNNNKVGCGDVFGAAFIYSYISNRDIFKAAELASSSAEFVASINDLSELNKLKFNVVQRYS